MAQKSSTRMSENHQNHKKEIMGCHEDFKGKENLDNAACSTPKGNRFKISETLICPPAPKKRRLTTTGSFKRPRIEFFAPPELDVFFLCAFTNNV